MITQDRTRQHAIAAGQAICVVFCAETTGTPPSGSTENDPPPISRPRRHCEPGRSRPRIQRRPLHHPPRHQRPRATGIAPTALMYQVTRSLPAPQIKVDDVTIRDDQVLLRIAEENLLMPEPLDRLITGLIAQRRNMGTAANPTSPWLLPGQRPNRPITTGRHSGNDFTDSASLAPAESQPSTNSCAKSPHQSSPTWSAATRDSPLNVLPPSRPTGPTTPPSGHARHPRTREIRGHTSTSNMGWHRSQLRCRPGQMRRPGGPTPRIICSSSGTGPHAERPGTSWMRVVAACGGCPGRSDPPGAAGVRVLPVTRAAAESCELSRQRHGLRPGTLESLGAQKGPAAPYPPEIRPILRRPLVIAESPTGTA
jgi:hypothetical protein